MGRIAILVRIEYEYEYEYRVAEYEYEKTHEQSGAPKAAASELLTFRIVISGGIGDHGRSCLASFFVLLVLSLAVLSPPRRTVLVLDGCWNGGDADRHRGKRHSSGLLDLFFTHQFCERSK
jgi:hypothetical protein